MKLNCFIIDDEPLARKCIKDYVRQTNHLVYGGEAGSAEEAAKSLLNIKADIIFTDIQMPGISGIDFVRAAGNESLFVFITAYAEYALEGYELNIIDYLLKPVSYERFLKTVNKAKEYLTLKYHSKENIKPDYFFIKCGSKFEKILFDDLLYAEALENYVKIYTRTKMYITYLTFKGLEEYLSPEKFIRVHKSYIVSLTKIENLDNELIKIAEYEIPLSRNYRADVMNKVIGNNLLRR
jgi:two-component system, LytTR family, response regulator